MSSERLSAPVRTFLREHIHSVAQLDILALLSAAPEKEWTARAIDRVLRSHEQWVVQRLNEFTQAGILEVIAEGGGAWRYRPKDQALEAAVAESIREYRTRPVLVIETIFKPDGDAAQSFADAFRLR
jgi:hypothetical protein